MANQVSDQLGVQEKESTDSFGLGDFFQKLNTSQYQQLVKLLTAQISSVGNDQTALDVTASFIVGTCMSTSINSVLFDSHLWIVDSRASRHICYNIHAFI